VHFNIEHLLLHRTHQIYLTENSFIWISASATSADGSILSSTVSTWDVNLVCFVSRLISSIMSTALSGRSSSTLVSTRARWSYLWTPCHYTRKQFKHLCRHHYYMNISYWVWLWNLLGQMGHAKSIQSSKFQTLKFIKPVPFDLA